MRNYFTKTFIFPIVCILYSFYGYSYASPLSDMNHTLHVYITNETKGILSFDSVLNSSPGSYITIQPKIIKPHETAHVIAEQRLDNDIAAKLLFTNEKGYEVTLFLLDQRQFHMGQSIFNMTGAENYSILISKTLNPNIKPKYLTYIEANLRVFNKTEKSGS